MNCVAKLHKSKVVGVGNGPKTNIFWKSHFYIFLTLSNFYVEVETFATQKVKTFYVSVVWYWWW